MNVFELYAKLGLDTGEYKRNLSEAKSKMQTFGKGIATAGKVAVAGFATITASATALSVAMTKNIKETAEYGDKVDKMSQKIGLSAKSYQQWDYVMQRAGTDVNNLKMGLRTLSSQAQKNSDAFREIGISQEEVGKLSKEDLLNKTITQLSKMEDGTKRSTLATKLLGRAGADLAPLLNEGSEEIQKQMKMAEKYGMVMGDEAVKASAKFEDSLTTLKMTFTGLKNKMMSEFLPSATLISDGLAKMFAGDYKSGSKDFEKGIDDLITKAKEILPKIATVGKQIIYTIGKGILDNIGDIAKFGTDIITGIITGVINAIPNLIVALPEIAQKIGTTLLQAVPSLVNSIKLLITTVFETLKSEGGGILQTVGGLFEYLLSQAPTFISKGLEFAKNVINGIISALPSALQIIFTQFPVWLENIVKLLKDFIPKAVDAVIDIFNNIVDTLPSLIDNLESNLPSMLEGIAVAIQDLLPVLLDAGLKLVTALVKRAPDLMAIAIKLPIKILNAIFVTITKLLPRFVSMGKTFVSKSIEGTKKMFPVMLEKLKEGFVKLIKIFKIDKVYEVGKNIVKGLWEGIKSMAKWIADKVGGFADGLVGKMKKTLGIHSPSRVFAEIGRFMAEGLGVGWSKSYDKVQKIINDGMRFDASVTSNVENKPSAISGLKEYMAEMVNANNERLIEALESTSIVLDNKEVGRAVRRYV